MTIARIAPIACLSVAIALGGTLGVHAAPPRRDTPPPEDVDAPRPARPDKLGDVGIVHLHDDTRGNVTLEELLAHARENAPAVKIAEGRMSLGEADFEAARPLFVSDPEFYIYLGPRLSRNATTLDIQAQIQQPVEIALERRLRKRAAERLKEVTAKDKERVTWEVEVEIRRAFRAAQVARLLADTASQSRVFNDRLLEIVQIQLREGDIAPLQLRLAQVQAAQSRQVEISAENAYRVACLRLAAVSGWPEAVEPQGPLPGAVPIPTGADLEALAAAHQQQLATLQAAVEHREAVYKLARRNTTPEPAFGVYYGRERDPIAGIDFNIVLGTVAMRIPVWQRNRREKAFARAEVQISRAERDAFAQALTPQIAAAASAVDAAAAAVAVFDEDILPNMSSNLQLLQRGFQLGEIDVLQVSVARERFFSVQTSLLLSYLSYFDALAALERVVGTRVVDPGTQIRPLPAPDGP